MKEYEVLVEFIDGNAIVIKVEAEDETEALNKAMPINLKLW